MTDGERPAAKGNAPPAAPVLGPLLLVLMGCELLSLFVPGSFAETASKILVLAMPLVGFARLRLREAYLLGLSLLLLLLAWYRLPAPGETLLLGLERAAFLSSFILLMGLLREGGITSPAVRDCGAYITRQPPQRRFLAVFLGSHFFSALINLGALSLLAPIIQRGVRGERPAGAPLDEIDLVRERRQLTALLRGFAWFLIWAPTAVTQAVLPTLIPGIEAGRLIVIGLIVALIMLLVSWVEDMVHWWPLRRRLRKAGRLPERREAVLPGSAFGRLGWVSALLCGLSLGFAAWGSVSLVSGVMLAAPLVLTVWVFAQQQQKPMSARLGGTFSRLAGVTSRGLPSFIREAVSLAAAGFIGTVTARLVPADQLASALSFAEMPAWLFLSGLSAFIWLGGQVALSPITTAVFLGSLVAELDSLPADPTLAALAIAAGTAICTTGAPFASGTLMLSRASGYSGIELAWKWNLPYTLMTMAVLTLIYAALTALA